MMLLLKGFSIGEMIKKGWSRFKANWGTWIFAMFILIFVGFANPFVSDWIATGDINQTISNLKSLSLKSGLTSLQEMRGNGIWQFVNMIVYIIISLGLNLGIIYMSIRSARGQSIHIGHLFARFQYILHYLFGSILFALITIVGALLLIFPAFIWGARFRLFSLFIADKGEGPIKSLKSSSQATYGAKWDVFSAAIVGIPLFIFAVLALFLGLLIAIPVYNLAWAFIYLHLSSVPSLPISEGAAVEGHPAS